MSTNESDARTGITAVKHVVAGMHIGPLGHVPAGINSVATIAEMPGVVPDGIHHRHLPLSYQHMDTLALDDVVRWTLDQVHAERTVLVRSERGRQRPGLVVGLVILRLGGYYIDAITCVQHADLLALSDFRYLNILRAEDEASSRRRHSITTP